MTTLILAMLLSTAPDGTATDRHVTLPICWWYHLGEAHEERPPHAYAGQGYAYWSVYAKGDVRLDAWTSTGWWLGEWPTSGVWIEEPYVEGRWRRYGMELKRWTSGDVLACIQAGSAYLWGQQLEAWGVPMTESIPAKACVSNSVEACR